MATPPLPSRWSPLDLIASPSAGKFVAVHSGGASLETRDLVSGDLPSHSLTGAHTVSGLTTGHLLKATGATSFGFAALAAGDPVSGGGANRVLFQDASSLLATSANLTFDGSQLAVSGSVLLGGDTLLYRGVADLLRTPDSLLVDGSFGIGLGAAPSYGLHWRTTNGFCVGADTVTDATTKSARYGCQHYTNAEKPFLAFLLTAGAAANSLLIGGGSSLGNAATSIGFYAGPTATTPTGTLYATLTPGLFALGQNSSVVQIGSVVSGSGRLVVRSLGATSGTNVSVFEDSAGASLLTLRSDGGFAFKGGTVGLAEGGWTMFANLSADRTCDANATTVDELADILGTLIEALKVKGILGG
ncbi:MAG: hypothetical protein KIS66_13910 [Fimbriimonadaceae bacterium]|nr:hypothetical protein [Fimbriimonadaceae bacterium]